MFQAKLFKCEECEKEFVHKKEYDTTCSSKKIQKTFPCSNCKKEFKSEYSFTAHIKACVKGKLLVCSKCDMSIQPCTKVT